LNYFPSAVTTTNTYNKSNKQVQTILEDHLHFQTYVGTKFSNFNFGKHFQNVIPYMYWLPKLHKNPYKQRFITSAKKCSTTQLAIIVTEGLKCVRKFWKNYCGVIHKNSRENRFWSISNSTDFVSKLQTTNNIKSINIYDFSTLYTSIPQNKLLNSCIFLLTKPFDKNKYLICNNHHAYFSNDLTNKSSNIHFDQQLFFDSIKFLINNSFITFGNKIFHQNIGIPMGQNYSPLLADLFLFSCEYSYLCKIPKDTIYHFNNVTRYIDDVAVINYSQFDQHLSNIYPHELEVTKSSNSSTIHYLDVKVSLDIQISHTIFDKRDEFNFNICNFPFSSSNIPRRIQYAVFISQLFRFSRICSNSSLFSSKVKNLVDKLISQGYKKSYLRIMFHKFVSNPKLKDSLCYTYIKQCIFP
jgi:hypothetical protein